MSRNSEYFVLTLPLSVEKWQADILDRRMEVNRNIYNALLENALRRYRQMAQTRDYRSAAEKLAHETDGGKRRECYRKLDELTEKYRLRKYDLTKDAAKYRKYFKESTDSPIVQNLAENVWRAVDRLITGKGQQTHFKGEGELNDLTGKTNASSIMYRDGYIKWKGLLLKTIQKHDTYETEALRREIRCCRIKRREVHERSRYYVDLVMEGSAPLKHPELSEAKGRVGLDMGLGRVAAVSENAVVIRATAENDRTLQQEKERLQGYMGRSRARQRKEAELPASQAGQTRNGADAESCGSVKRYAGAESCGNVERYVGAKSCAGVEKVHFEESGISGAQGSRKMPAGKHKNYEKARRRYRELCRKERERRRHYQNRLANELLAMGNCFLAEKLDYAGMKRQTAFYAGRGKRRNYGREITDGAPGAFLAVLEKKCRQYGKGIYRLSPEKIRAAGLNHAACRYEKIPLSIRHRLIAGKNVDKYLYSAFLLQHAKGDEVDIEGCRADWERFLVLHDAYLDREGYLEQAG